VNATSSVRARSGVALAHRELDELAARLDLALPDEGRVGADLLARTRRCVAWPAAAPLVRAADGWVHPGPATAWAAFADLAVSLGAPPSDSAPWPSLLGLPVDRIDAEAAAWHLPAAAVCSAPARPDPVPELSSTSIGGATVVVLGTAWATPLAGSVLRRLGARVVKIEHPRRPDPFPLRSDLVAGQEVRALDLDAEPDRDQFVALLDRADLLLLGHPRRVLDNAGITPRLPMVHVAAFADRDGPGYGPAAEAHGGWATRHDPPRLGRTSVADPVAAFVAAATGVHQLTSSASGTVRVSLEGAVGRLLDRERRDG
jgi:hypothetical protein